MNKESLFLKWDGQKFQLDNGDSFQICDKHLFRGEYPNIKALNLIYTKPSLARKWPDLVAKFKAIGIHNVTTIESNVLYEDNQTKPLINNRPRPLKIYI